MTILARIALALERIADALAALHRRPELWQNPAPVPFAPIVLRAVPEPTLEELAENPPQRT